MNLLFILYNIEILVCMAEFLSSSSLFQKINNLFLMLKFQIPLRKSNSKFKLKEESHYRNNEFCLIKNILKMNKLSLIVILKMTPLFIFFSEKLVVKAINLLMVVVRQSLLI